MILTPERLNMIRRLAREDPYWHGYLAAINDLTQPPETPGVSSCQEESQP